MSSCGHAGNRGIVTPKPMRCKRFRVVSQKSNEFEYNVSLCIVGGALDAGEPKRAHELRGEEN